jgi:hypothetical protein
MIKYLPMAKKQPTGQWRGRRGSSKCPSGWVTKQTYCMTKHAMRQGVFVLMPNAPTDLPTSGMGTVLADCLAPGADEEQWFLVTAEPHSRTGKAMS